MLRLRLNPGGEREDALQVTPGPRGKLPAPPAPAPPVLDVPELGTGVADAEWAARVPPCPPPLQRVFRCLPEGWPLSGSWESSRHDRRRGLEGPVPRTPLPVTASEVLTATGEEARAVAGTYQKRVTPMEPPPRPPRPAGTANAVRLREATPGHRVTRRLTGVTRARPSEVSRNGRAHRSAFQEQKAAT